MKIQWFAHASFLLESIEGIRLITDPYDPSIGHDPIRERADIVTVSHSHYDHANITDISGTPKVVNGAGKFEYKGVKVEGIRAFHDASAGAERGQNIIYSILIDTISIVHLGDLGHLLKDEQAKEIGKTDILLIPVGGTYTLDFKAAQRVVEQIKPAIVIPMHFKTKKLVLGIDTVERFLSGKNNVLREHKSYFNIDASSIPQAQKIVVLTPAR
ncbi:MAG: MBL fold metallo-hydrolase [Candidatus Omnitrophota bacterium]